MTDAKKPSKFLVVLIKPSHYDDDGYVIQWRKAWIPSNSLACLYGLTLDLIERRVFQDVEIELEAFDEMNTIIPVKQLIRRFKANGNHGIVMMTGVQSNQFPRAMDIARRFRDADIQVAVGGFHVSGIISMLKELTPDLKDAQAMGVSFFAGEAEQRLGEFYADAMARQLKPIYNYMADLPALEEQVTPFLPERLVRKYDGVISSFDAGRGCPFQCSFCTIINVQGRKSRYRSADDIEKIIRDNHAQGVNRYFITDDNFARNKNWEALFDRMIQLREEEDLDVHFLIQVDTLCHKIPGFVEKAARAGCKHVFIGLENIDPENLEITKKRQNRITEYRTMFQMWRESGVMTYAGYIIGFPVDTPEKLKHNIEIIQRELPVDMLEFTVLTPLPGSEDHKVLFEKGTWMDPDMNRYDLEHSTTEHPTLSAVEMERLYKQVWRWYYTDEHIETLMKRAIGYGIKPVRVWQNVLEVYGTMKFEGVHAQQGGFLRRKVRTERRPERGLENPLLFYPRRAWELLSTYGGWVAYGYKLHRMRKRLQKDASIKQYRDFAMTPVADAEGEALEMFTLNEKSRTAVARAKAQAEARAAAEARKAKEKSVPETVAAAE